MNPDLMRLSARINNAVSNSSIPSSDFYKDQSVENQRIDDLIQKVAPSMKGAWESFKSDLSLAIEIDKEIRSVSSLNEPLENLEKINPSLQQRIQTLKERCLEFSSNKNLTLKDWLSAQKEAFLQKVTSEKKVESIWSRFIKYIPARQDVYSLANRVINLSIPFLSNSLLSLFRINHPPALYRLLRDGASISDDSLGEALRLSQESFEQERTRVLEQEKDLISQNKLKLNQVIRSLSMSLANGEYGNAIEEAFLDSHPSVITRSSFLKFLLIEGTRKFNSPLYFLEIDIPEKSKEKIKAVSKELIDFPLTEIELEHLFLSEDTSSFSKREKEISQNLTEAVQEISSGRNEEQVQVRFLHDSLERMKKGKSLYEESFTSAQSISSSFEKSSFLMDRMNLIGNINSDLFLKAAEMVLEEIRHVGDSEKEILENRLLKTLLEPSEIPLIFAQESSLLEFCLAKIRKSTDPLEKNNLLLFLIPSQLLTQPADALKSIQEVLAFDPANKDLRAPVSLFKTLLHWIPRNIEIDRLTLKVAEQVPLESRHSCLIEFAEKNKEARPKLAKKAALQVVKSKLSIPFETMDTDLLEKEAEIISKELIHVRDLFLEDFKRLVRERIDTVIDSANRNKTLIAMIIIFSSMDNQFSLELGRELIEVISFSSKEDSYFFLRCLFNKARIQTVLGLTNKPKEIDKDFQDLFLVGLETFCQKEGIRVIGEILSLSQDIARRKDFKDFGDLPSRLAEIILKRIKELSQERTEYFIGEEQEFVLILEKIIEIPHILTSKEILEAKELLKKSQNSLLRLETKKLDALTDPIEKVKQSIVLIDLLLKMENKKNKVLELGKEIINIFRNHPGVGEFLKFQVVWRFSELKDQGSLKICLNIIKSQERPYDKALNYFNLAVKSSENREVMFKKGTSELSKLDLLRQRQSLLNMKDLSFFEPIKDSLNSHLEIIESRIQGLTL